MREVGRRARMAFQVGSVSYVRFIIFFIRKLHFIDRVFGEFGLFSVPAPLFRFIASSGVFSLVEGMIPSLVPVDNPCKCDKGLAPSPATELALPEN